MTQPGLAELLAEIRAVGATTSRIETEVGGLKTEVGGLKSEVGDLKTEMGDLKSEVGDLKTEVGDLKTEVGGLSARVAGLETVVSSLDGRVEAVERRLDKVEDRLDGQGRSFDNFRAEIRDRLIANNERFAVQIEYTKAFTARLASLDRDVSALVRHAFGDGGA